MTALLAITTTGRRPTRPAQAAGNCKGSSFDYAGSDAYFWSSTDDGTDYARNRNLYYDSKYVGRYGDNRSREFSVRCVRD